MIAYHASPVLISRFRCTEQGVHVGSLESALEAVSRKIGRDSEFFLHRVEVDTSRFVEEIDHGYDWRSVFEKEVDTVNGYVYSNRYEPSSELSCVTWKPEETLKILDVSKKTLNDFRKKG